MTRLTIIFSYRLIYYLTLAACVATAAQALQAEDVAKGHSCVLAGRVTFQGSPVKGAEVSLRRAQGPDELSVAGGMRRLGLPITDNSASQRAKSDEAGSFCFNAVEPGQYSVSAKKVGYMETPYQALSPFESGAIVSLRKGEGYPPIDLKLVAQSVLTGMVRDQEGEPIDQGTVVVTSKVALEGAYRTVAVRSVPVNDLGEFRVAQLPPGQYYIRYQPTTRPSLPRDHGSSPRDVRVVKTFYPGAIDMEQASPVVLQAGETLANIFITAQRHNTYSIRGRLAGLGGVAEGGMMNISSTDEEQTSLMAGGGYLRQDNSFTFDDVSPGGYIVSYIDQGGNYLQAPVTVRDGDVENLLLRPAPIVQIKGRIDATGSSHLEPALVKVMLKPAENRLVSPAFAAKISDTGAIRFDQPISSGAYALRINTPEGFYVKGVRFGSTDVSDGVIKTNESGGDLSIIVSGGTGQLSIHVDRDSSEAVGSVYYVVASSQAQADGQGLYTAVTGDDGSATLKNVVPGRYRVYAFRSVDFVAIRTATTLKALEAVSKAVEVNGGVTANVSVGMVSPDQAKLAFAGTAR
jgi:hypothetical protein